MSSSNAIGDFDLNLIKIRKSIQFPDLTIQSTAYTGGGGVPSLSEVLLAGNIANNQSVFGINSIEFNNFSVQTTAAPICGLVNYIESVVAVPIPNSAVALSSVTLFTQTLPSVGQYLINFSVFIQLGGDTTDISQIVTREFFTAPSGLSNNSIQNYQYPKAGSVYPGIGEDRIVSSGSTQITTTEPNAVVTLNLEAFWTGDGTLGIVNREAFFTFVGFA